jgi:hypothetical protein
MHNRFNSRFFSMILDSNALRLDCKLATIVSTLFEEHSEK